MVHNNNINTDRALVLMGVKKPQLLATNKAKSNYIWGGGGGSIFLPSMYNWF